MEAYKHSGAFITSHCQRQHFIQEDNQECSLKEAVFNMDLQRQVLVNATLRIFTLSK